MPSVKDMPPLNPYAVSKSEADEYRLGLSSQEVHDTRRNIESARTERTEMDSHGKKANEAGAKLDAGKVCPSLIIEGMARALWGVAEVATFGMVKYTRDGWISVPDGKFRYANAQYRHTLKRAMGETVDPDSHLEHLKHEAWNALAKLDLAMREQEKNRNETKISFGS